MGLVTINILDILKKDGGEEALQNLFSSFSCPLNAEITDFLAHSAIPFAQKNMAITHFVFDEDSFALLGFYTLTTKAIEIKRSAISSKTLCKKLERHFRLDEGENYVGPCYLIAQLSKNYTDGLNKQIEGKQLLDDAFAKLKAVQKEVGGSFVYIECEDREKLIDVYHGYQFVDIDERTSEEGVLYKRMIRKLS